MTDSLWKEAGRWALCIALGAGGGGVVQYARTSDVKQMIDERLQQEDRVNVIREAAGQKDIAELKAKLDQLITTTSQIQASQIRSETMDEVRDQRINSLERERGKP